MNIILNSKLKEVPPYAPYVDTIAVNFGRFITGMSYKLGGQNEYQYIGGMRVDASGRVEEYDRGFLAVLSNAYSDHRKIQISPHDLWVIVLTQLAGAIKKKTELCRLIFTNSDKQIEISVPTNDISKIDLSLVIDHIKTLIPVSTELFIPTLESVTEDAQLMMHAALCDAVQHYYRYSTFMCGIPEIRVMGPVEDWHKLLMCVAELAQLFTNIGYTEVVEYLIRVGDVFDKIQRSFFMEDVEFWKNIFTQKNVGSGGELEIDGWIKELFIDRHETGPKIQNFMTSLAIVPYKNLETGNEYKAIHGGFKRIVNEDGYLQTEYGQLIYHKTQ